jgi:hypothetical protein
VDEVVVPGVVVTITVGQVSYTMIWLILQARYQIVLSV